MKAWAVPVLVLGMAAVTTAGEDDLAVVKRALESPAPQEASKTPLKWLKVRVVEKGTKKTKVSVNIPLSVARAFQDLPVDLGCSKAREGACHVNLKAILANLENLKSGQELVEVDDDDATVKVWVE